MKLLIKALSILTGIAVGLVVIISVILFTDTVNITPIERNNVSLMEIPVETSIEQESEENLEIEKLSVKSGLEDFLKTEETTQEETEVETTVVEETEAPAEEEIIVEAEPIIAETEVIYEEPVYEEVYIEQPNNSGMTYLGAYRVTFYCPCAQCCGQWAGYNSTASGVPPTANHTAACGSDIPFGTTLYVDGLGYYVCEDRGVGSGCIDIFVNDHSEIPEWGMGYLDTYLVEWYPQEYVEPYVEEVAEVYEEPQIIEEEIIYTEEIITEEVVSVEETITEEVYEEEIVYEEPVSYAYYTPHEFKVLGVLYWGDWRWTWYSQRVLPGGGLNIPGRHVDENGYVCDENGYICLASSALSWGTIVDTPLGKIGRVYDDGCDWDVLDVYVDW